jgi:hypothetical protein
MDNVWKFLKKMIIALLIIYFISFLFYTDFLLSLSKIEPPFDFSRYFFKILNLE